VESIGLLAGGVAHDFNNLLTVLNGYAEMALEDAAPDSNIREHLLEMRAAGERAAALTHQLLAFSRKQLLQPTVLNLNYVVTDLQRMLRRLIGEHIEIVTRLTPTLGNVMADAGQIEQIIMNLAVNARDAMPNGGTLTLETADVTLDESYVGAHPEARTGPHVMLAVTDTGTGMTPAVQARLFEPFFTTKPKGAGTGLGLATVYGMVKQSEGSIWVYSEVGRGTSFKIYLPVTDASAQSAKATPKSDLHGNETILIVEDQSEVRKLASRALERYGYKVLVAANGEEALAVSQGHLEAIHLLLTDVVMPGMTGREVAHSLLQRRPGLRVLFMSGYTEGAFPHNEMVDAQSGYLEKPFTPESLAERVRDVLGPLDARATILVVDEDDGVRRTLCKMLTAERYAVIEAVNGRQALEHVRNGTEFDLVIINLLLLEQEGIEVIQSMKRRFPGLKIIVISETPHLDVFNAASKLGADVGLQGPLDGEDLCRTVQRLLAERAIAEKG
jgi:CheY-like chemotaxis protein